MKSIACCVGLAILTLLTAAGCRTGIQRSVIFERQVTLPAGRFVGPIEFQLPRKADDPYVVYEIHTSLHASCAPRLRVTAPDGQWFYLGATKARWQTLLAERARIAQAQSVVGQDATTPPNDLTDQPPADFADQPPADFADQPPADFADQPPSDFADQPPTDIADQRPAEIDGGAPAGPAAQPSGEPSTKPPVYGPPPSLRVVAPPQRGHWERVTFDSWPGQQEFLALQARYCARAKTFRERYDTALDENGRITIWGEVPQEMGNAMLTIRVIEATDVKERRQYYASIEAKERKKRIKAEKREMESRRRAAARHSRPKPPRPPNKHEKPGLAKVPGATWIAGYWFYKEQSGRWVWISGQWKAPATTPALRVEGPGVPPLAGCKWESGYWVWLSGEGEWRWQPGHWLAPPPKQEARGAPPVPESPWQPGRWVKSGDSFRWVKGRWGNPLPRAETIPPPPFAGAKWRSGLWLNISGNWKWQPGYYEDSVNKPPPPKRERPGASPHPQAVWLGGFWLWQPAKRAHRWIAGHWELPPGEGYEWVPAPPDPQVGRSIGGEWRLRVDLRVKGNVGGKVKGRIEVRP